MSKLFAWEGALTVAPKEFDGAVVSSEFPTFEIDRARVAPTFLSAVFKWPGFYASLATTGMGDRRQRVNPDAFLAADIPLPSLDEERRVAARLAHANALATGLASGCRNRTTDVVARILDMQISRVLARCAEQVFVADVATMIGDLVRSGEDLKSARAFVGLEHLVGHFGVSVGAGPVGGETGRKFRFAEGDVLYGYLRPYQNKVWLADRDGLCSVEQFVLRAHNPDDALILWFALRGRDVLDRVVAMTNRLQLPRLASSKLMAMKIGWPKPSERTGNGR